MNTEDMIWGRNVETLETYACVCWTVGDVMKAAEEHGIKCTAEQAEDFLAELEELLEERMIERGWDTIVDNIKYLRRR